MNIVLSKTFDFLRFPLALLVVYIHIDQIPQIIVGDLNFFHFDFSTLYYVFTIIIAQILARVAVPSFFLISGYLYFINIIDMDKNIYLSKTRKRFFTLFIPYVFWNILGGIYFILLEGNVSQNFEEKHFLFWLFLKPADFPLWFVRDLIIFSLFTPIFYILIKYFKYMGLIMLGFIFLFFPYCGIAWMSISSLFFFYFGAYCGFYKINIGNVGQSIKWGFYIVTIILIVTNFIFYGYKNLYLTNTYLLIGVFSLIFLVYDLIDKNRLHNISLLTSASFFIYAIHRLGITGISKTCLFFLPNNYWGLSIKFFISPLITAILCLILYVFLKKFTPKFLSVITGGK